MTNSTTTRCRVRIRLVASALVALVLLASPFSTLASSSTRLRSRTTAPSDDRKAAALRSSTDLGFEREQALYAIHAAWARGEQLALEEVELLQRFLAQLGMTQLEADVLISRVLFRVYVVGDRPDDEQERLLEAYLAVLETEGREVTDVRVARELAAGYRVAETESVAAPPVNDQCSGSRILPGAGPFPILAQAVNILDATTTGDPNMPSCIGGGSRSIWYRFAPTTTAFYRITTCADAPTATTLDDTYVAVYRSVVGCAAAYEEVPFVAGVSDGCSFDGCRSEGGQAEVITQLTASMEYFIVVWMNGSSPPLSMNATVQLRIERSLAPANDTCAGPSPILLGIPVAGTTVGATNDYQLAAGSPCFTGVGQTATTATGRDTVHSFTAPSTNTFSIRASGPGNNDSNIVLYVASTCPAATPGSPVNVTCTAASSRSNSRAEQITLALSIGQQVFVFVDDAATSGPYVGTPYQVEVTVAVSETESNNTTGTADPLSCGVDLAVSPANDVDFFTLGTPAAGSRVFALLDGATISSTDIDMRVTTTVDTLERDRANAGLLFGIGSPAIAGTPLTGVASFLRINRDEADQERAPLRLYSVVQPPIGSASAETEPNNTIGSSDGNPLNYFSGTLAGPAPSTDIDVYRAPAITGDLLFVALDADPTRDNTPFRPKIALIDPNGNVLIESTGGSATSSTTSGAGSLTSTTPFSPAVAFVYRVPTTGTYYVRVQIDGGSPGTGDYLLSISSGCSTGNGSTTTGGGVDTPGIYVPATGAFFLRNSNSNGNADVVFTYGAGGSAIPLTGDWNGDGVDSPGLYDSSTGAFFLRNANSPGPADLVFTFGAGGAGILPLTGDWDGDGFDTIGLYSTATGNFFLRNSNSPGVADLTFSFGAGGAGVLPLTGDWNADGADTVGIYIAASGTYFLRNQNSSGAADLAFNFGPANATPLTGDWNGDGTESIGIYIPGTGTFFLRNSNTPGNADFTFTFGGPNSTPLMGDWNGQ